jgi:hypothetical protein
MKKIIFRIENGALDEKVDYCRIAVFVVPACFS